MKLPSSAILAREGSVKLPVGSVALFITGGVAWSGLGEFGVGEHPGSPF